MNHSHPGPAHARPRHAALRSRGSAPTPPSHSRQAQRAGSKRLLGLGLAAIVGSVALAITAVAMPGIGATAAPEQVPPPQLARAVLIPGSHSASDTASDTASDSAPATATSPAAKPSPAKPSPAAVPAVPPGVAASHAKELAGHNQVVVVAGDGPDADTNTVTAWTRSSSGWVRNFQWSGFNGGRGWSDAHVEGDKRTPIGVYSLTNAGGYSPNPGTKLAYQHEPGSYARIAVGVRVYDYVLAINYNHVPGTVPTDLQRPMGYAKGGDIWFHLAHGGGTNGCIGISREAMGDLLRWLDPAATPVVLMGPKQVIG